MPKQRKIKTGSRVGRRANTKSASRIKCQRATRGAAARARKAYGASVN